jgi:Xaa-Pro aminopeptidase
MKYELPVLYEQNAQKNKYELDSIKKALSITEGTMLVVRDQLVLGVTELEIAHFVVRLFKQQGVRALAFPPIVAFGIHTAHIHHIPTQKKLRRGDLIMIDVGATWKGYCADMTRTFIIGEPTQKQRIMYTTVFRALHAAEKKLQQGVRSARKVDGAARNIIEQRFGKKAFGHTSGHGVGQHIHEWPHIGPNSDDVILNNTVCTIEPGVYIPKTGGVRIEDMVYVTKNSAKVLTKFPNNLSDITISCA